MIRTIESIRQHARNAVEALDTHGIAPEPPNDLCEAGLKEWRAAFYAHCVAIEKSEA